MSALCHACGKPVSSRQKRTFCSLACYHAWQADRASQTFVARFWAKVKQTPTCWLWTANVVKGYGQMSLPRQGSATQPHDYAHRIAWRLTNGPITDNLSVLHRCDTPLCVNPDHLFLGTQAENLADARRKGRLVDGAHLIRIPEAVIAEIRATYQPRVNGQQLAAQHGISVASVVRIARGRGRFAPIDRGQAAFNARFERVPHLDLPVIGEVA